MGVKSKATERSVIQVGESALAVTLPSWWAKIHGIKPKTRVGVEVMADGSLKIIPRTSPSMGELSKVIRVPSSLSERGIIREVIASYLAGFTRIKVEYPPDAYSKISNVKKVLEEAALGLTLLEEGYGYMEYYIVVNVNSMDVWESIRRAYRVTLSMLKDTVDSLRTGSADVLREIPERDTIVDRLYLYFSRKVNMVLLGLEPFQTLSLKSFAEVPSLVRAVKSIERIADHTVLVSLNSYSLVRAGSRVPEDVLRLIEGAYQAFETSGKALLSRDKETANTVAEIIDRQLGERAFTSTGLGLELKLILDSIRRILSYSLDIAEIVIDLEGVREAIEILAKSPTDG